MSTPQPVQIEHPPLLTKEQWTSRISELWILLLDLKVFQSRAAIEQDFRKTCGAKKLGELTAIRAMAYIKILKEKRRAAEAKIPDSSQVAAQAPGPAGKKPDSAKATPSTQSQFSTMKRLEAELVGLGAFDDKGASRMWLAGFTEARCYIELTELQAVLVIGEMTRMKRESAQAKSA